MSQSQISVEMPGQFSVEINTESNPAERTAEVLWDTVGQIITYVRVAECAKYLNLPYNAALGKVDVLGVLSRHQ